MTDLPSGWEWSTIGEIADVAGGIQKSPRRRPMGNAHPMLRVANVQQGRLDLEDIHQIELFNGELDRLRLIPGDCLVVEGNGSIAQVGRAAMWRGEVNGCVHQNHVLRARPRIEPLYLVHWLRSPGARKAIESAASSTSGLHVLSGHKLRNLAIPVGPRAEQERIVAAIEEILSRVDAAEAALNASAAKARLLTRATVAHLFDDADWPWTTLGEIAEIKGGVTKDTKRQGDPSFIELPYLRVANVQRGRLDLREVTTIRVAPEKGEALRLLPGDLLFNEGGDRDKLGRGWVWEGQIEHCIHQNHVFRARLTTDAFDPYFVSTHANTWGQAWFERHGRQTTNLASINMTTLRQFPVPAPPIAEQAAIVAELQRNAEVRDRLIAEVGRNQRRVATLRSSILAAAFSGQLVPQDQSEEPASMLLDRIRDERRSGASSSARRKTAAAT